MEAAKLFIVEAAHCPGTPRSAALDLGALCLQLNPSQLHRAWAEQAEISGAEKLKVKY